MKKFLLVLTLSLCLSVAVGGHASAAPKTLRIGVMLPFRQGAAVSQQAVEFYRGIMMAVDSLRSTGTSFRVYTYNTADKPVASILRDTIMRHLDIVFGPDDKAQLQLISEHTAPNGTKLVDAFCSDLSVMNTSPQRFMLLPTDAVLADSGCRLLASVFDKPNIIVVDTKRDVHPLCGAVKGMAKKVRWLGRGFTNNELKSRLDKHRNNLLLLSSADLDAARETLAAVALFRLSYPDYRICVVGYQSWLGAEALKDKLHAADTYILTPYYNNVNTARNQAFLRHYRSNFQQAADISQPLAMALYGFDAAYLLLKGLINHGSAYADQPVWAAPLQNPMLFARWGTSGGMVNQYAQFIHYSTDGATNIISSAHE